MTCVIALAYIALPGGMETGFGRAVALSLLGSCAGFLLFNSPPAKIFMGDSGSSLLGFTAAFLALDYYRVNGPASTSATLLFPVLAASLPLLDAALAMIRRVRRHRSPWMGDRSHFYDLLLDRGWSARKVLFTSLGISAAFAVVATACLRCSAAQAALLGASSVIACLIWIVRLGSLQSSEVTHPVKGNPFQMAK